MEVFCIELYSLYAIYKSQMVPKLFLVQHFEQIYQIHELPIIFSIFS